MQQSLTGPAPAAWCSPVRFLASGFAGKSGRRRRGLPNVLWIVLVGLLLAFTAQSASADTITSGTLVFTLGGSGGTDATGGSFTYDNTTNQFLSFTATWDGLTFDFSASATPSNYQALIGAISSPMQWSAVCEPSSVNPGVPCDGELQFRIILDSSLLGTGLEPFVPTQDTATGAGSFTVTQLQTAITPEPDASSLLLLGLGMLSVFGIRKPHFSARTR